MSKVHSRARQTGIVLVIVLIVLVAMTLAGVSLMRSVNTTTLVAGNLAFRQAATYYGDVGTESAVGWLQNNSGVLDADVPSSGYFSSALADQTGGASWDSYWTTTLDPTPVSRPVAAATLSGNVWTLPTDTTSGNTVSYVIHRLCLTAGARTAPGTACAVSPASTTSTGGSMGAGAIALQYNNQSYYRITARIEGPRNTVSYIQTIVAQ